MARRGANRSRKSTRRYYYADWEVGGVYHVYNSAVMPNILFADEEDHRAFIKLLKSRVTLFAEVFAYALVRNHFHLAIRLKTEAALREMIEKPGHRKTVYERKWLAGEVSSNKLIGDYWATIFTMYASYYNVKVGRRGTLLDQTVRRIRVREDLISRRLIMYIHTNEVKHRLLSDYQHSGLRTSYAYYALDRDDHWLSRDVVLARFGGLASFYQQHRDYVKKYGTQISAFDEILYFEAPGLSAEVTPYVAFLEDAPPPRSEQAL